MTLDPWFEQSLESLKDNHLFRELPASWVGADVNFCSNDYLGLSKHPEMKRVAKEAIDQFGLGSSGSRLVSGNSKAHVELEKLLADWYGKEDALFFNSGYNAGVGVISAVSGEGVIFSDQYNHASLVDGCRLSKAETVVYEHANMAHLESLLKQHSERFPQWIVSETVFSMDGDKAPLNKLVELKKKYKASLLIDEAHAVGVYGDLGRGLAEELGLFNEIDLLLGMFGKALGSFGAFAVGDKPIITWILNKARSFIFTTAVPPLIAAANVKAIELVKGMKNERLSLRKKAEVFRDFLKALDFVTEGDDSPIIPLLVGDPENTLRLSKALKEEGIWVQAIRPPTVPKGMSRLRITLSLLHQEKEYQQFFTALKKVRGETCPSWDRPMRDMPQGASPSGACPA